MLIGVSMPPEVDRPSGQEDLAVDLVAYPYHRETPSRLTAMNSFDTLFILETAIFSETRYPLLLFFIGGYCQKV